MVAFSRTSPLVVCFGFALYGGCSWDWDALEPTDGACAKPQRLCGGICVDVSSDKAHCGACDSPCPRRCDNGQCLEVKSFAIGLAHVCGLVGSTQANSPNRVYCWGSNSFGQLGASEKVVSQRNTLPTEFSIDAVTQVASGDEFNCALRTDESIWCWGRGDFGNLSKEKVNARWQPQRVVGVEQASYVATGTTHACAIVNKGRVLCWGSNGGSECGTNSATNPVLVPSVVRTLSSELEGATQLVLGDNFSCALKADELWCWGRNHAGVFGTGTQGDARATAEPVLLGGKALKNIVHVSARKKHMCAALANGAVVCWGNNEDFEGGVTSPNPLLEPTQAVADKMKQVGVGFYHSCAIHENGQGRCWGNNGAGQLGIAPPPVKRATPVEINVGSFVQLAGGEAFTCGALSTGDMACWGSNNVGQLARPSANKQPQAELINWAD